MDEKLGTARIETPRCPACGMGGQVVVQMTDLMKWMRKDRPLIQDCFPALSPALREQVLTGIHPACWQNIFPPEEVEEFGQDELYPIIQGEPTEDDIEIVEVGGTLEDFYRQFNLGEAPKA